MKQLFEAKIFKIRADSKYYIEEDLEELSIFFDLNLYTVENYTDGKPARKYISVDGNYIGWSDVNNIDSIQSVEKI